MFITDNPDAIVDGLMIAEVQRVRDRGVRALGLVRKIAGVQSGGAGTAALLMDVGQLVPMHPQPDYTEVQAAARHDPRRGLVALEQERYGHAHTHAGALQLHHWGLPTEMVDAVALGHSQYPRPTRAHSARTVVFVARALVDASDRGCEHGLDPAWLAETAIEKKVDNWQQAPADIDMVCG